MKIRLFRNRFLAAFLLLTIAPTLRAVAQTAAPRALPPATEQKLRELLADPVVQQAHVGLSVVAIGTAKTPQSFPATPYAETSSVLFEVDAGKRFLSASNTKLFTAALALHELEPDGIFHTEVATDAPDNIKDGILDGNLFLLGYGDPSLTGEGLRQLAQAIVARGIKRVRGEIIAVPHSYRAETFGGRYPDGWTLDDSLWYYGPEISSLAFNRNQIDVVITGGERPGAPASVQLVPPLPGLQLVADVKTGGEELSEKSSSELLLFNKIDSTIPGVPGTVTISGAVAPKQKLSEGVAIPDPPLMAGQALKRELEACGVVVEGARIFRPVNGAPAVNQKGVPGGVFSGRWPGQRVLTRDNILATLDSPPLRVLLRRLLKNSDNLYAEMLLRGAATYHDRVRLLIDNGNYDAAKRGHELLFEWLGENKIDTTGLRFTDGSGLSRYNLITPHATAKLLAAVDRMPGSDAFWDAMPIAGVDGTLRNRMRSTPAANNVRAKTGTFSIVSTLSGYVTTRDGHRLAVSLLTNFAPDGTAVRNWQDKVYALLAEAGWSTPAAN